MAGLLGGVLQPLTGVLANLGLPTPQATGLKEIPGDDASHKYQKPGPTDVRGMCPTLNTMANHGYVRPSKASHPLRDQADMTSPRSPATASPPSPRLQTPARSRLALATTPAPSCLRSACCRVETCRLANTASAVPTLVCQTLLVRLWVSASTASSRSTTPSPARMRILATRPTSSSLVGTSSLMLRRSESSAI